MADAIEQITQKFVIDMFSAMRGNFVMKKRKINQPTNQPTNKQIKVSALQHGAERREGKGPEDIHVFGFCNIYLHP
jgi:hypothetical protein